MDFPRMTKAMPDLLSNIDGELLKAQTLSCCGYQLLHTFRNTGDDKHIVLAIAAFEQAVSFLPPGDLEFGEYLHNVGLGRLERFTRHGRADDLQIAIDIMKKGIIVTAQEHAELPSQLNNLGTSFLRRFENTGTLDDLSEGIRSLQRAIELTPDRHPDMPVRLSNLGMSLLRRFESIGILDDLSQSIQSLQRAMQLTPDGSPRVPTWLNNLGASLSCRFERTGNLDDLLEAIRNQQRAVQLTPEGHPNLPGNLSNLGVSCMHRFMWTGDLDDISKAIRNQQRAIQLTSDGHPQLSIRLKNLGNSFFRRFERSGDLDDIYEAVLNQQRAVLLTPDGHPDMSARLNNLGNSLARRFESTGVLDDLLEGIKNHRRAVQLTPHGNSNLPAWVNDLGNTLLRRFEHTRDAGDLSEALQNLQSSIQLTPEGHPSLLLHLNNFGISLLHCFNATGSQDYLSAAIQNQQRGISLTPNGHPQLPNWLGNLGTSLLYRYECSGDVDDLSEAIQHKERAVLLTPEGHATLPSQLSTLGLSWLRRFENAGGHEFLAKAIANYRRSATSVTGPPSLRLQAAKQWASCSRRSPSQSSQLMDAYGCIVQLLSVVSGLENTVERRHQTLLDSSQLSIAAAAAALSLGKTHKAVEWLVEGRCIVWNQINQLRTPLAELRAQDPDLADRFSAVSRELEEAGSRLDPRISERGLSTLERLSLERQAARHTKLAKQRDGLLAAIRDVPGFQNFLQPRRCADIMRKLPEQGVVIIINVHSDRCDALALMAGGDEPLHIPLDKFSYEEAKRLASGLRRHLLRHGVLSRIGMPLADDHSDSTPAEVEIDLVEVLSILWTQLVWPILESLFPDMKAGSSENLPQIWWCPTGPLTFLPIHAAGNYIQKGGTPRECLSNFAVSSYIPTVNALLGTPGPNSVEKHGDTPNGLLIVSQPNTPNKTKILGAAEEANKVERQLEKRRIPSVRFDDQYGTVEGVLNTMESLPSIHLACHASQNTSSPLKSSIYLHDGSLQLSEIIKKNLSTSDFAFLSACQTSTGDENLPDEVVHLAAGMLAAGYRSVVGTMWSIFDNHGPNIAEYFYESLLYEEGSKIDGARAARALHQAMQRFREKKLDSPDLLLVWVPYIHIGV